MTDMQRPSLPLPLPSWEEVVAFELAQVHCRFCGDAIVRVWDRFHFESWPHQVVCPTCVPLAESALAPLAAFEEDARPLVSLAQWAAALAAAIVAAPAAVIFALVVMTRA